MFRNYLKIALRNLSRYRFISFINIFGLAVGLTCCLLILCYIMYEVSYDRYHDKARNTYRVERTFLNPETGMLSLQLGTISPPFGPLLTNDFKEIQTETRFLQAGNTTFKYGDKIFTEPNVYFADEHFFDVFTTGVTKGNPRKALEDPYSVMLTETVAHKYFGNEDPINKMVRLDNQINCRVTGVYKELPANTHFHPNVMISFNTLRDSAVYGEKNLRTNWGNNSFFTYIVLPDGYNPKRLEAQFPAFLDRHMAGEYGRFKPSQGTSLTLRKLTDIHLYAHNDFEAEINGDSKRVYIFSAIALFILLIACINYMNLSTARSVLRAKEIGIRKVAGAEKRELVAQFLTESVFITWMSALLAFVFTWLALPWLNRMSGLSLDAGILFKGAVIVPILLMPFITGILAGLYPALFLSSFQPIRVLKGLMKTGGTHASFRRTLVVMQFGISIALIICTAIVFRQLQYMQNMSLGFNKEQIVTLPYNSGLNKSYESFKTALLADAGIKSAGRSSRIPSGRLLDASGSQINRGDSLAPTKADIKFVVADEQFIPTYNINIVAGRNFSRAFGMDTSSYLINEEAVRALGLHSNEEAIGKPFSYGGRKGILAGVFADFHFEDLHQRIVPLVLYEEAINLDNYGYISVKVTGNLPHALQHIERTWKKFLPETPYTYTFLNDRFGKLYNSEQKQGSIFTAFAGIAIFIACLGLFGLSAFATTQRVKEIGIRKVLGAGTATIVGLLSADFLKLVGIAALLAFPVAWYAMHQWLNDFAYRTSIPWWIFLLAGCIAALVALVTISFQAIKAALANPVKSLRSE